MKKINTKAFASILIAIIFIVDIAIPPGTALAILYVIPLALIFDQSKKTIFFFSSICCVLTVMDDLLYFNPNIEYSIFMDSFLAIIAIILSSFATIKYKTLKQKNEKQKEENLKAVLEMLFMISHRLRQPICSIQGLNALLENHEQSIQELKEISYFLKDSIGKLDQYSEELTNFLTEIRKNQEMDAY
jgi:signal transduction histidine kinase